MHGLSIQEKKQQNFIVFQHISSMKMSGTI